MNEKKCTKCKKVKKKTEFPLRKASSDGVGSWCKECATIKINERKEKIASGEIKRITKHSKECKCCGETKPSEEFRKRKDSIDGLHGSCRICSSKRDRRWQRDNREKTAESSKRWSSKNKEKVNAIAMRKRKNNPERYAVYNIVNNAIRSGKLIRQSCEECGNADKIQAHHDDYLKPLDVRWLCQSCHTDVHRKHRNII